MRLLVLSFFFILTLSGCDKLSKLDVDNSSVMSIKIPPKFNAKGISKYSEIFSRIKLVPLETTSRSRIGRIDKIVTHNGNFYILDQVQSKAVFQFDKNGKFIRRFGKVGSGPGSYNEPNDISIRDDKLTIWVNNFKKFIVYDLGGNLVKEIHTDLFAKSGVASSENRYVMYQNKDYVSSSEDKFHLKVLNEEGNIESAAFEKTQAGLSREGFVISQNGESLIVSPSYSGDIFSIGKDVLIHKYHLDFGNNSIPMNLISKYKDPVEFQNMLPSTDYAWLSMYFESKDYLVFSFVHRGLSYYCYYCKKTKNLVLGNNWFNNLGGIVSGAVMSMNDNEIISIYDPKSVEQMKAYYKSVPNEQQLDSICKKANEFFKLDTSKEGGFIATDFRYTQTDIEMIQSMNSFDNPVIIVGRLKEF